MERNPNNTEEKKTEVETNENCDEIKTNWTHTVDSFD